MVVIVANYSKKIGLPAYSSHQYSVSLTSEVADLSAVERESAKLYAILQQSIDREMQEAGFVPEANGHGSPGARSTNGYGADHPRANGHGTQSEGWACSDKQRDLILKIVDEHKLDKEGVEGLSKDMFHKPVKVLNKLEASGLIEELLNKYGPTKANGANGNGRRQYQRGGARQ